MKTLRPPLSGRPQARAFTLIELLVVITIISILAALTMGTFAYAQQSASRNRTTAGLSSIVNALEQYKEKFGEYPEPVDKSSMGSGSSSQLHTGGAIMLYQAITGDGYDNIKDADKTNPTGPPASDGKVDQTERAASVRGDLPKSMILKSSDGYMLIDGFGHPYQYAKGGDPANGGDPDAVNTTFDIWSCAQKESPGSTVDIKKDVKQTAAWIKNW